MKLYTAARSSASFRVRIALNLKGLSYESLPINLRKGEQRGEDFLHLNPQGLVPALVSDEASAVLTQSTAIIEWLEETHPAPAFLPSDAAGRARVRALAQIIACDIHPLNNLKVLHYLDKILGLEEGTRNDWYRHWVAEGFAALESLLTSPATGRFCHGDQPGYADIYLVPQVVNALRYKCDLTTYPILGRIYDNCLALPAFAQATPEQQPDFV